MRANLRTWLRRASDYLIPWGVGLLVALSVLDALSPTGLDGVAAAVALGVVQGGALRWRRTHPEWVTLVTLVASAITLVVAPEFIIPFSGLFAVGSLAAARPPRISILGLAGLFAVCSINFIADAPSGDALFAVAVAFGAWALGEAARTRRVAIDEVARRAVGEEQARIARELHDVIAHSVSVIVVQAAAADDVFDSRPEQARAALRSIESSGREAMLELRRLLSAVRSEAEDDPRPAPGVRRLDDLVERIRAGGVDVEVRREGVEAPLAPGIDLSAYRILQEALTNVLRHARASSAEVTLRFADDAVELDVFDDGIGALSNGFEGTGRGIVGMRERAALVGGELEAGPLPGGGFRVHARLPLEAGG